MTTPNMPAQMTSREYLRIGGGYDAAPTGASPAGGLDIDHAGHLAMNGDLTVKGRIHAGTTAQALTDADGKLDGARLQDGTVSPDAVNENSHFRLASLELISPSTNGIKLECSSAGHFKIVNSNSNFLDLDVDHPAGAQIMRVFRNSTGASASLVVYSPNSTNTAFSVDAASQDVFIGNDCSAASFTDRSPFYRGNRALEILRAIRPLGRAPQDNDFDQVDHATLGPIEAARTVKDPETGVSRVESGRDLGKQVVINSAAILALEHQIASLEERLAALEQG